MDIRFTCPQVHQLVVKLNSTHIPLTGDEICRVSLAYLRVLDTENLHRLIETHPSFRQHQNLVFWGLCTFGRNCLWALRTRS